MNPSPFSFGGDPQPTQKQCVPIENRKEAAERYLVWVQDICRNGYAIFTRDDIRNLVSAVMSAVMEEPVYDASSTGLNVGLYTSTKRKLFGTDENSKDLQGVGQFNGYAYVSAFIYHVGIYALVRIKSPELIRVMFLYFVSLYEGMVVVRDNIAWALDGIENPIFDESVRKDLIFSCAYASTWPEKVTLDDVNTVASTCWGATTPIMTQEDLHERYHLFGLTAVHGEKPIVRN